LRTGEIHKGKAMADLSGQIGELAGWDEMVAA